MPENNAPSNDYVARIKSQSFLIHELSRENRDLKSLLLFIEKENAKLRERNVKLMEQNTMQEKELEAYSDQLLFLRKAGCDFSKIFADRNKPEPDAS